MLEKCKVNKKYGRLGSCLLKSGDGQFSPLVKMRLTIHQVLELNGPSTWRSLFFYILKKALQPAFHIPQEWIFEVEEKQKVRRVRRGISSGWRSIHWTFIWLQKMCQCRGPNLPQFPWLNSPIKYYESLSPLLIWTWPFEATWPGFKSDFGSSYHWHVFVWLKKKSEMESCVSLYYLYLKHLRHWLSLSFSVSLFNVVTFPNDPCDAGSRNGTCYTKEECSQLGGTNDGSCAQGYGVCCTCNWYHSIQKLLKMSHLNFWILAFSTNFFVLLSGNTVWP